MITHRLDFFSSPEKPQNEGFCGYWHQNLLSDVEDTAARSAGFVTCTNGNSASLLFFSEQTGFNSSVPKIVDSVLTDYQEEISPLRDRIDEVDLKILQLLSERLSLSVEIAEIKKLHGQGGLDLGRWRKLLKNRQELGKKMGVSPQILTAIFYAIHNSSLLAQKKHRSK